MNFERWFRFGVVASFSWILSACGSDADGEGAADDDGDADPNDASGSPEGGAGAGGLEGEKGEAGVKGDPGVMGDAGEKGDAGVKGDTGEKGDAGVKGDPGDPAPLVTVEEFSGSEGTCTNGGVKIVVESDPVQTAYVCAAPRFRVWVFSGEHVVFDETTGVMWQRYPALGEVTFPEFDWQEASDYCDSLEYAGFSDWKLPDHNQLAALVLLGQEPVAPTVDRDIFPFFKDAPYWSGEEVASDHFGVDFATGTTHLMLASGAALPFRCVR